jgi:predicted HAD superfamily Cof-like phosphohydrolase
MATPRPSFERIDPLHSGTSAYRVWEGTRVLGTVEGVPSAGRAAAYWRAWRPSGITVICPTCRQPDRFPTRTKAVEGLRTVTSPGPSALVKCLCSQQLAPSNFELTREFHRAIGQLPEDYSDEHPNPERYQAMVEFRARLLREEAKEAIDALDTYAAGRGSLVSVAGELADVLCVTYGAAAALRIPMDAIYREFHRSVMTKVGGPVRADGKVLKGEGYQPPDLERVLSEEGAPR